jgi:hypothetical protein
MPRLLTPRVQALLSGSLYGATYGLRQVNGREKLLGIQVVFAGFINHPELLVLGSVCIRKDLVDFSALQRGLVAVVSETDHELLAA